MMGRMSGTFYIRGAWDRLRYVRRRGLMGLVRFGCTSRSPIHYFSMVHSREVPCPLSYSKNFPYRTYPVHQHTKSDVLPADPLHRVILRVLRALQPNPAALQQRTKPRCCSLPPHAQTRSFVPCHSNQPLSLTFFWHSPSTCTTPNPPRPTPLVLTPIKPTNESFVWDLGDRRMMLRCVGVSAIEFL